MLLHVIGIALVAVTSASGSAISPIIIPMARNPDSYRARVKRSYLEKRDFSSGNSSSGTTTVQRLYNRGGIEYHIEVGLGTPAQKFNLTLDTGSATLWVPSTSCDISICPKARFNISASTSAQGTDVQTQITYGSAAINGTYYLETVTVANLTIFNQSIVLANETAGYYQQIPAADSGNGIIGLGFPAMNYLEGYDLDVPFVFNLVANNLIPEPIFSIYLNSMFEYGYSGEIMLGGIDETKYTGSLTYVPVAAYTVGAGNETLENQYIYWTVRGTGIITSTGFNMTFDGRNGFMLDTGATFTYGPKNITDQIAQSLTGLDPQQIYVESYNMYIFECGLLPSLDETIEFTIATDLQSPSNNPLTLAVSLREMLVPLDGDTPELASQCALGIEPLRTAPEHSQIATIILGETVLRSFYAVYDMGQRRVGFAPAIFSQSRNESSVN